MATRVVALYTTFEATVAVPSFRVKLDVLAAVVLALASIILAPLNALARMRTDDGLSDYHNPLAAWWAHPAMDLARPILDWASPDTVYETYGKFYVFAVVAVIACALGVRSQRPERRGWAERRQRAARRRTHQGRLPPPAHRVGAGLGAAPVHRPGGDLDPSPRHVAHDARVGSSRVLPAAAPPLRSGHRLDRRHPGGCRNNSGAPPERSRAG